VKVPLKVIWKLKTSNAQHRTSNIQWQRIEQ